MSHTDIDNTKIDTSDPITEAGVINLFDETTPDDSAAVDADVDPESKKPKLESASVNSEKRGFEIRPDKDAAAAYLKRLDLNATGFTFQTFDDNKDRKDIKLTRILHGTLDEHWAALVALNKKDAGIFVPVNETDLKGRKNKNITRIRTVFIEDDDSMVPESLPLEPQIRVESSSGKQHVYFLTDSDQLDEFDGVQQGLVDNYGSDPNAKDITRVLRVPGFFNNKYEQPHMVRIIKCDMAAPVHSWDGIKEVFAPNRGTVARAGDDGAVAMHGAVPGALHDVGCNNDMALPHTMGKTRHMLKHGPASELSEFEWKQATWAIARAENGSDEIREELRVWSKEDPRYDAATFDADFDRWREHEFDGVGIGTIYKRFTDAGGSFSEYEREKRAAAIASVATDTTGPGELAIQVQGEIAKRIRLTLGGTEALNRLDMSKLAISAEAIDARLKNAFWNPKERHIFMIGMDGLLQQYPKNDAHDHLQDVHGALYNEAYLNTVLSGDSVDNGQAKQIRSIGAGRVMHYLTSVNQRKKLVIEMDMFSDHSYIEIKRNAAAVTYAYTPFEGGPYDETIINDYKEHFAELEQVLAFLAAARFASDRRDAYLLLRYASSWGKGFFMSALLQIGAGVKITMEDVESLGSGKAVGLEADDFCGKVAVIIDEVKHVNRQLKELTNTIAGNTKYQMVFTTPIYAKILMAAEEIMSLTGSDGIEDQYANRISAIGDGGGAVLAQREVFKQVGRAHYYESVKNYIAARLNLLIKGFIAKGRTGAAATADNFLDKFTSKHTIKHKSNPLSTVLPSIAGEFLHDLLEEIDAVDACREVSAYFKPYSKMITIGDKEDPDQIYLRSSVTIFKGWVDATRDKSEAAMLKLKAPIVTKMISSDGRGSVAHRNDQNTSPPRTTKLRMPEGGQKIQKIRQQINQAGLLLAGAKNQLEIAKKEGQDVTELEAQFNDILP